MKDYRSIKLFALSLAMFALAALLSFVEVDYASAQTSRSYDVKTITLTGYPDGTAGYRGSIPTAMSPNGVYVTGYSSIAGSVRPWLAKNGVATLLPILPGQSSATPAAVNNAGLVVGSSGSAAVEWVNGTVINIGSLGGPFAAATGINSAGEIVGTAMNASAFTRGFAAAKGNLTGLPTLGGIFSYATGIDDAGDIVGYSYVNAYQTHPFSYSAGKMIDLGSPGGNQTIGVSVASNGHVAGYGYAADNVTTVGFYWRSGLPALTVLKPLVAGQSVAVAAINRANDIVGTSGGVPTIWYNLWPPNDLTKIVPGLLLAAAINDAGVIAGAVRNGSVIDAVVLTPK